MKMSYIYRFPESVETLIPILRRVIMARMCALCGKKPVVGHHISHAHNLNKRRFKPNLQRVRAMHQGRVKKMLVCTNCIKSGHVVKAS